MLEKQKNWSWFTSTDKQSPPMKLRKYCDTVGVSVFEPGGYVRDQFRI